MQIKNLKNDKKSLENKLELLIEKEASKFSDEQIQVMENGTITDPIHVTTQEVAKSTEKKTYSDVGVQTMEVLSVDPMINKTTSVNGEDTIPTVNRGNTAYMIRENHVTRNPYRHPNHKIRYLKQSEYQYHLSQEQLIYRPKNIDIDAIKSHDNSSSWKCNVPQRIELGWSDPFMV
jgi:hypothetical protein